MPLQRKLSGHMFSRHAKRHSCFCVRFLRWCHQRGTLYICPHALQKEMVANGLILHSDQGSQYSSQAYYDLSQEYHFTPSMSKRGCPYDNASMENFFGTLKSECLHRMKFGSRKELEETVAQYVHFYNYERIQLKSGLTPYEIWSKTA